MVRRPPAEHGPRRRDRARRVPHRLRPPTSGAAAAQTAVGCYRRGDDARSPSRPGAPDETSSTRSSTSTATTSTPAAAWPRDLREPTGARAGGGPRHGRATRGREGVPHVLARLGARDRRDLRGGLRAAPSRDPVPDSPWLDPPSEAVRRGAAPRTSRTCPPRPCRPHRKPPVIIERRGVLRAGRRRRDSVRAARARAARHVHGQHGTGDRQGEDGAPMQRRPQGHRALLDRTRPSAKIDLRDLGPARCTVALRNTGSVAASYYGAAPPGDRTPRPLTHAGLTSAPPSPLIVGSVGFVRHMRR